MEEQNAKNQKLLITLLFWFFLGGFGAHRFYLGWKKSACGILALTILGMLTAVIGIGLIFYLAVFIWWIVDLVFILQKKLKFADGSDVLE